MLQMKCGMVLQRGLEAVEGRIEKLAMLDFSYILKD
jgi:hypothetical protein